jgi:Leucine rich repeat
MYACLLFSVSMIAMDNPQKEYSVQDMLNSNPRYVSCIGTLCTFAATSPSLTSVVGIENVDGIASKERIILDNNSIRLQGSPFKGKRFHCNVLTLNSNGIITFNPEFFAGLKHLHVLELKNNKLEEIKPEDLKALRKLTTLVVTGNKLSDDNKDELAVKFPEMNILF